MIAITDITTLFQKSPQALEAKSRHLASLEEERRAAASDGRVYLGWVLGLQGRGVGTIPKYAPQLLLRLHIATFTP